MLEVIIGGASHIATAILFLTIGQRMARGQSPIPPANQWPMLRKILAQPETPPAPKKEPPVLEKF